MLRYLKRFSGIDRSWVELFLAPACHWHWHLGSSFYRFTCLFLGLLYNWSSRSITSSTSNLANHEEDCRYYYYLLCVASWWCQVRIVCPILIAEGISPVFSLSKANKTSLWIPCPSLNLLNNEENGNFHYCLTLYNKQQSLNNHHIPDLIFTYIFFLKSLTRLFNWIFSSFIWEGKTWNTSHFIM